MSCIMVDIDHFKRINDTFRHAVGDQVLQRVGQLLSKAARESDIVCRYGGEEFAILLPHTGIAEAAETAERLRQCIEEARFPQRLRQLASSLLRDREEHHLLGCELGQERPRANAIILVAGAAVRFVFPR